MTTPAQVFDYDMKTRARVLRKTQEIPSGHDPSLYVTRRVMAPAKDGETVPVSLLYRKETKLDGTAPLLLYGYGAYGMSIPAGFSTNALSLVDRGFVYAIAHVRGGKDKGYRWYKDGKREKKVNSFTDFIAAGEFLAEQGFTARGRIVAHGGSAGGMLMGAVANWRPTLFLGIIAEVPFVDVLTTMLDASLPLTPPEWPEWGNPIESEADYRTIAAYSPYDNVRGGAPAYSRARRAHRSARDLLGAGEVVGEAPRTRHRLSAAAVSHQYGGGACRRERPFRTAEGGGARLRLRAEDRRRPGVTSHAKKARDLVAQAMTMGSRVSPGRDDDMMVDYQRIITIEPGKRGGRPCVRGMRIAVADVLGWLAAGMSHEEILSDYPELTEEDIRACLAYAADRERRASTAHA